MLSRVHRRMASRVAAALVAVALSGVGSALAQMPRASGTHVCSCPRGDHDCTCPVCSAASAAARARKAGKPPCHPAAKAPAPSDGDAARCCISSACRLPEAVAAIDRREVFTLVDSAAAPPIELERLVVAAPAAPRHLARSPEVPPPRPAPRS